MTVINGAVNVTVRVDGVGRGPQKVDETRKALDKIERSSKKAGGGVGLLKGRVDSLKEGVGPVNILREGFEWLNSNLNFVNVAAAGLVTVFTVLWDVFDGEPVNKLVDDLGSAADASARLAKKIKVLGVTAAEAQTRIRGLSQSVYEAAAANARAEGNLERADFFTRFSRVKQADDAFQDAGKQVDELKAEIRDLDTVILLAPKKLHILDASLAKTKREFSEGRLGTEAYAKSIGSITAAMTVWSTKQAAAEERLKSARPELVRTIALHEQLGKAAELAADRTIQLDETEITPDTNGGGGATKKKRYRADRLLQNVRDEAQKILDGLEAERVIAERLLEERESRRPGGGQSEGILSGSAALQGDRSGSALASQIRDFSAALSESLPGLAEWSGALKEVAGSWGDVAAANDDATAKYEDYLNGRATEAEYLKAMGDARKAEARGAIASVGAIATAGAESIKNERVRAGVLATIHLGLGTALMFVPGAQQEALGHLAGAAILGSVAIFGGSRGSGSSSSSSRERSVARQLSDRTSSGAVTLNIFGGWFGTSHPQETAAALHSMIARGGSGGYVPMPRAA